MRRFSLALASAVGGILLAPVVLPASGEDAPRMQQPLVAAIEADSNPVDAGQAVRLDASRSRGVSDTGARFEWDLDGDGSFETDTGAVDWVRTEPATPGTLHVQVRVSDAAGKSDEAVLSLVVRKQKAESGEQGAAAPPRDIAQPDPASAPDPPVAQSEPAAPAPEPSPNPDPPAGDQAGSRPPAPPTAAALMAAPTLKTVASSEPRLTAKPVSQVVRAAGSAGVSMRNFAFSPSSVRVNVGDSVTWTNQDPAPHNAKGSGVSTPTIKKGQSASQTFSKAGTFSYICTIHPSMHGTVVVAGAASSGGSSGGGSDSSGDSSPSTDSGTPATGSGLPQTGLAIGSVVLVALMLLGSGELLRRLLPERE